MINLTILGDTLRPTQLSLRQQCPSLISSDNVGKIDDITRTADYCKTGSWVMKSLIHSGLMSKITDLEAYI